MSKFDQKIVLFIETAIEERYKRFNKPCKIGNLFMNRFAIDEAATHEILKIYYLENTFKPSFLWDETLEQGMDLINNGIIVHDS